MVVITGELFEHISRVGPLAAPCCQFVVAGIISALQYLHQLVRVSLQFVLSSLLLILVVQGYVHRDIKPENIVLDSKVHSKVL